jgi:hypothetical protein
VGTFLSIYHKSLFNKTFNASLNKESTSSNPVLNSSVNNPLLSTTQHESDEDEEAQIDYRDLYTFSNFKKVLDFVEKGEQKDNRLISKLEAKTID